MNTYSMLFHIFDILLSSGCFKVETMQDQDNTPADARVMAWWDYGYQITGIGAYLGKS
jgi:asparagine N-glycosylation enzyme membrane subunit Stt3